MIVDEGGRKGLLKIEVGDEVEIALRLPRPPSKLLDGRELSNALPGELLKGSLLELGRAFRSIIPSISSRFVSNVSSGSLCSSLGGTAGGTTVFCFPRTLPRRDPLAVAEEVDVDWKDAKDVDV